MSSLYSAISILENETKVQLKALRERIDGMVSKVKTMEEKVKNTNLQIKQFVESLDTLAINVSETHKRMGENFEKLATFVFNKLPKDSVLPSELKALTDSFKPPIEIKIKKIYAEVNPDAKRRRE